jgi:cell division protein FtsI (penicillin-binding protein 3)
MAKPTTRIATLQAALLLGSLVVVGRAAQLQILEGAKWRKEAEVSRRERILLPARRGGIHDREGRLLAVTQEAFEVGIAPNELEHPSRDGRTIARALGIPPGRVARDLASKRWVSYPGPYSGLDVQPLRPLRGVYLIGHYTRHYPNGPLARGVVGSIDPDSGNGASGIEMTLDRFLRGVPGEAEVLKDQRGRRYESPARLIREPEEGREVYLTIDAGLQEIAERSLDEAVEEYSAAGGDIVVLDPGTGEVLAAASLQTVNGRRIVNRPSFFTDPFEPGSTAKLFTAAALLTHELVAPTDAVSGENGRWNAPINSRGATRLITDTHEDAGELTLARAIQVSSNIAMAKFSLRLLASQQFDMLRDFGFGSPTGVEFPSETRGVLRMPDRWQGVGSQMAIATGYEFQVTPVQLAAAYAAIANDGVLLTPSLVREVRSPDGRVLYRHMPEPVRRSVSPEVAATLRDYLRSVLERGGTAEASRLTNYSLAGKTGTARRNVGQGYEAGRYTASFAGIFPADNPQLVVVVKVDDPGKGRIYAAQTAAPLTRLLLEEALAARHSAIDRGRLGGRKVAASPSPAAPPADEPEDSRVSLALPIEPDSVKPGRQLVPNVRGSSVRRAAYTLHRRGFHVAIQGAGVAVRTSPAAGDSAAQGATVTVWAE